MSAATYLEQLLALRAVAVLARELGRPPGRGEWTRLRGTPSAQSLVVWWGSDGTWASVCARASREATP